MIKISKQNGRHFFPAMPSRFRVKLKRHLFILKLLGDTLTPQGKQYDIKSGQWFGSVVQSSGPDGTVLVLVFSLFNARFIIHYRTCTLDFGRRLCNGRLFSRGKF